MSEVRKLAREEPGAVRSVAEMRDDKVREILLRILEEENPAWFSENVIEQDSEETSMSVDESGGIKWE